VNKTQNSGDDIAGIIHSTGPGVTEFKAGDRVFAFHKMQSPHGAFAEYGIAYASTTAHLPDSISFESGATLPLVALTAVNGFHKLGLPTPLNPAQSEIPLLIYGASTAVGCFAIQLAKLAGIYPIIGIAGSGIALAEELGADVIVDRRNGQVVEDVKKALGGKTLLHVFDAISEGDSIDHITKILEGTKGAKATWVLPVESYGKDVETTRTNVGFSHEGSIVEQDLAYVYMRLFSRCLQDGRIKAHPFEVVPGGLNGVQEGLRRLQKGEVSAKKLVFRVADTEGVNGQ
jgi:NADPH2:quinone reductase